MDRQEGDPSLCSGSRLRARAGKAPRLADSASSLYTTGFPIHSAARHALFRSRGRGGCMGRLCRGGVAWAVVTVLLCFLSGCGGKKPPGPPNQLVKITLFPAPSTSVQVGT